MRLILLLPSVALCQNFRLLTGPGCAAQTSLIIVLDPCVRTTNMYECFTPHFLHVSRLTLVRMPWYFYICSQLFLLCSIKESK